MNFGDSNLDDSGDLITDAESGDLDVGPRTLDLDDDFGFRDYVNNSIVGVVGMADDSACKLRIIDEIDFVLKPYEKLDTEGERLRLAIDFGDEVGIFYRTLMDVNFLRRSFVNGIELDGRRCFLLPLLREKLLDFWQRIISLFSTETYFISIHGLHLINGKLVLSTNVEVFDSSTNRRLFGSFYWGVDISGDVNLIENSLSFDSDYGDELNCSSFDSALEGLLNTNYSVKMNLVFAFDPRKKSRSVSNITKDDVIKLDGEVKVRVDS